jgi:predicted alpha/beta-hydrolase family hydrolase
MSAVILYPADPAKRIDTLLVLAHGAGAGQSHPFMVRYARGLAERGLDVVTFNFPYMDAKRSAPDRPPVLEEAFRSAIRDAVSPPAKVQASRIVIGGKSMGGRIATHLAAAPDRWPRDAPPLAGVVALGYPLKPPGGAQSNRVAHLFQIAVPTLIVQGTRDNFGGPEDIRAGLEGRQPPITIHPVEDGDHSFAVRKSRGRTQEQVDADIWDAVNQWVRQL